LLVVTLSFALDGAKLLDFESDRFALPLGLGLFAIVIGFCVWARSGARLVEALPSRTSRNFPTKEHCNAD